MKQLSVLLLEKAILWIEDSYFNEKQVFEVKIIFSLQKMLTDGLELCGVLSAVWTLILTAPIHCRGAIGEQLM